MITSSSSTNLPFAVVGLILVWLVFEVRKRRLHNEIWSQMDTVGVPTDGGTVSWALAMMKSVIWMPHTIREGYEKFSKSGKPFALPTMWVSQGAVVVLPLSMINLLNKPRNELSSFRALNEGVQFPYQIHDKDVWSNAIHFEIVPKHFAQRDMPGLGNLMLEEWDEAFRKCWGHEKEGVNINAWTSMVRIIAHVASRIMVGLPGCRDKEYMDQSVAYAEAVLQNATWINCMPPMVRPVAGRLFALKTRYLQQKLLKVLVPMVEQRMQQDKEQSTPDDGVGDVITWLIDVAKNHGPEQMDAVKIAMRILAFTTMFHFAIGWVFAHAVLNIHSDSSGGETAKILEAECRRVSKEHNGLITKEATDALHQLDSALRESMRISDVMVYQLPLDVIAGKPVDLGQGRSINVGSNVRMVFPTHAVHRDSSLYEEPSKFDAFRFSREHDPQRDFDQDQTSKRETATSVTPSWLFFGYGRHACPGRWFVSLMVKQALAYVLLNYDVEVVKAPKRWSLLSVMLPPQDAELRVVWKRKERLEETM